MFKSPIISFIIFLLCIFENVHSWDSQEMQMFDLVEEVKENFYIYLGVSQNASNSEIGKAYRKLTLRYHPDKNPSPEDASKFRHLVAIYEVLKDEQMRGRYDEVLKNGLPDWRMPSFYYRKLRKMPLFEIIALFSVLSTCIHYACLWGVYFEKKFDMEDHLNKIFRRKREKDRKRGKGDAEEEINKELNTIPKPTWKNILPLVIVMFIYSSIVSFPFFCKTMFNIAKYEVNTAIDKKFEKSRKVKAKEEERKKLEEMKKQKKERKLALSKEKIEIRKNYELAKKNAMMLPIETFIDLPQENSIEKIEENEPAPLGPWTDENTILLIKALTKFPSGVKDRWVKISEMVKRPISEVTSKVKEIQQKSREGKIPIQSKMQSSLGEGISDIIEQDYLQGNSVYIPNLLENDQEDSSEDEEEEFYTKTKAQLKKERKKMTKQMTAPICITKSDDLPIANENEEIKTPDNEDNECNVQLRKKPRTKASYLEAENVENADCIWSQTEQKQLEDAMRTFPNGTTNRWDRIVQKIPTKTKIQCIDRIKKLSQAVQSKQTSSSS